MPIRAAREVINEGTFHYADDAIPDRDVSLMMSEGKRTEFE